MLSQVNHELEGSDGSTPPSSPIGWLVEENSIELEILQVMQWQTGGHAPVSCQCWSFTSKKCFLPWQNQSICWLRVLLIYTICKFFNIQVAWAFLWAFYIPSLSNQEAVCTIVELWHGSEGACEEGSDSKYFGLWGPGSPCHLCYDYSSLPLQCSNSYRQYRNEWGWMSSHKTLFTKKAAGWIWLGHSLQTPELHVVFGTF